MLLAEQLVGEARERRKRGMDIRERSVEGVSAFLFVAAATVVATTVPLNRAVDVPLMFAMVAGYAIVTRVRFEFADGFVSTEQLVFVPMLLLLPVAYVPLLVALAKLLANSPELMSGTRHRDRWVTCITDSWFCIGPVLVIAMLAPGTPDLAHVGIYVLAFVAEVVGDIAWSLVRDGFASGTPIAELLKALLGTARVDAILSPMAFITTVVAVNNRLALLVIAPLVWLFEFFSRDRRERYSATLELNRAYRGTVMLLADVVAFEDGYTAAHSRSVVDLVQAVSEEMNVPRTSRQELEFAALLHDIGKISVPKEILHKPGKLDDDEFELMKTHTIEGQFMLDRVGGLLGRVGEIVRSCHERWDGKGYPDGLLAEEIPIAARIVFVCDAYNAMTTDRPYRAAMSSEDALAELVTNAGAQFDPAVVHGLLQVIKQGEPESRSVDEVRALLSSVQLPDLTELPKRAGVVS
jgi:HD-GYP domain-containing protein (c-di-GMP phosphodiesterase class II)